MSIVGIPEYKKYMEEIMPGREINGLFFQWVKSGENFDVDLDRTDKFTGCLFCHLDISNFL